MKNEFPVSAQCPLAHHQGSVPRKADKTLWDFFSSHTGILGVHWIGQEHACLRAFILLVSTLLSGTNVAAPRPRPTSVHTWPSQWAFFRHTIKYVLLSHSSLPCCTFPRSWDSLPLFCRKYHVSTVQLIHETGLLLAGQKTEPSSCRHTLGHFSSPLF